MPISQEQINELIQLQIRRDFLKEHAQVVSAQTQMALPITNDPSIENPASRTPDQNRVLHTTFLSDETTALEQYLTSNRDTALEQYLTSNRDAGRSEDYINAVLLPQIKGQGISRALGAHFARLTASPAAGQAPINAYVQLVDEGGLCFYWTNEAQAAAFVQALKAHGFPVDLQAEKLPGGFENGDDYRTDATQVVKIPHLFVEKLISLAQYHPNIHQTVLADLYRGKTDRATSLLKEAQNQPRLAEAGAGVPVEHNVGVTQVSRVSFSEEEDLIAVTVGARKPTVGENKVPHLIIVVDDSGSMSGPSMEATNKALNSLIQSLPDETVVSIQSMNQPTSACRQKASDLKVKEISFSAIGATPLLETTMSCAAFYRAHPLDLVIPKQELDRTTMIVLTDGQPNGAHADTVDKLVAGLQTSMQVPFSHQVQPVPGFEQVHVAFGTQAIPCEQMPMVLGFSIGQYGDTQFMQDLAKRFGTPQGYIRTDYNLQSDMSNAMSLVAEMQGRADNVLVGITHSKAGSAPVGQKELFANLVYGYARTAFFRVPKNSDISATLIHGTDVVEGLACDASIIDPKVLTAYIAKEFEQIKREHAELVAKAQARTYQQPQTESDEIRFKYDMVTERKEVETPTRGGGTHKYMQDISRIKQEHDYQKDTVGWQAQEAKFRQATLAKADAETEALRQQATIDAQRAAAIAQESAGKDALLSRLTGLKKTVTDTALLQELNLFEMINLSKTSSAMGAGAAGGGAQYTSMPTTAAGHASATSAQGRAAVAAFEGVRGLGVKQDDMSFRQRENDAEELYLALRKSSFQSVLSKHRLNLCATNEKKSTVAHSAAWEGLETQLLQIIKKAKETGQLNTMLSVRNLNHVGGITYGETVLDNVRMSPKLDDEQKKTILKAIWTAQGLSASHRETDGNTPLMCMLTDLRESTSENKAKIHKEILDYLTAHPQENYAEGNYGGSTALHFALWNQEYQVAEAIIEATQKQGPQAMQTLLAARNRIGEAHHQTDHLEVHSGGEVPHMNLVAQLDKIDPRAVFKQVGDVLACFTVMMPVVLDERQEEMVLSTVLEEAHPMQSGLRALRLICQNLPEEEAFDDLKSALNNLMQSLNQARLFMMIYDKFKEALEPKGKTQLAHLYTVYDKAIQGYAAFNFLMQSPLMKMKEHLDATRTAKLPEDLAALPDALEEVYLNHDLDYVEGVQQWVEKWLKENPLDPRLLFSQPHRQLLGEISHTLTMLKHYEELKPTDEHTATFSALVKSIKSINPAEAHVDLRVAAGGGGSQDTNVSATPGMKR